MKNMFLRLIVLGEMFLHAGLTMASFKVTYTNIPDRIHYWNDAGSHILPNQNGLRPNVHSRREMEVQPDWRRAQFVFEGTKQFLRLPLPSTNEKSVTIESDLGIFESDNKVLLVPNILKVRGQTPMLQELVAAGITGRDIVCELSEYRASIEEHGERVGWYSIHQLELALFNELGKNVRLGFGIVGSRDFLYIKPEDLSELVRCVVNVR